MRAYAEAYLSDVVENQGKLFDFVAQSFPDKNTEDFINTYMKSKTRKSIDEAQAYVNTMDVEDLWSYFLKTDHYRLQETTYKVLFRTGLESFTHIISGTIIYQVQKLFRKFRWIF